MTGRRRRHDGPSTCRWCGASIMWQTHLGTGRAAPIDWAPVPGGNILIHGETYEVLVGSEREAMDPTVVDENATPTLRINHWATCSSTKAVEARRRADERRAAETHPPDVASLRAGEHDEVDA